MSQLPSLHVRNRSMRCVYCVRMVCHLQLFTACTTQQCWPSFFIVVRPGPASAVLPLEGESTPSSIAVNAVATVPIDSVPPVAELLENADKALFKQVMNNERQTLHRLLPPLNSHTYNLRKRIHNYQLPKKGSALQQSNFITRVLFCGTY